jgi:hypothetical protein
MNMLNRPCIHCRSTATVILTSTNEIICADCKKTSAFRLKVGQKAPLEKGKRGA